MTGIVFHPRYRGIAYARTDIGGVYRYRYAARSWESLCGPVSYPGRWETYPLSIALSPFDADTLYVAAGDGGENNFLCLSRDRGENFTYRAIPVAIHGNAPGRGTGERLMASPIDADTLYFASQTGGLLVTRDSGRHWEKIVVQAAGFREETNLTTLFIHPDNARVMVVGTNGAGNRQAGNVRGSSLYYTVDGGAHFQRMPGQPEPIIAPESTHPGYVAQRMVWDGRYLYVTFLQPGNCWMGFNSYAADTGSCFDGVLLRYSFGPHGEPTQPEELTPREAEDTNYPKRRMQGGLAGLCVDPNHPGLVLLSTVCHPKADTVFISQDYGKRFRPILHGLATGVLDFTVPYMKPEYNGGASILHWMSDLAIDPFDGNFALVASGTGIFGTGNLLDALKGNPVRWQPLCDGLEETVHLNVYSPSAGPILALDMVGDLGGFAFTQIGKPCENSFADAKGNRYITCINADYPEASARPIVVTARGNWTGRTTGGLILSVDDGQSWQRLPDPQGINSLVDELLSGIRRPNVNAGFTAIAADGETIVWGLAQGSRLPIGALVRTEDRGLSWQPCRVYDL
ncbi:MAG: endoglucanase, partial [Eubacteriales bacterium]|nr:endoglucanase [Eubacteriales bacterium]